MFGICSLAEYLILMFMRRCRYHEWMII
uniref:Uncharacterized protein n=1 Tax=Arundo donax TaxID=35708 RepID=A0A0A9C1L5_ARUDO